MSATPPKKPPTGGGFSVPQLTSCLKNSDGGLDKACSPGETVRLVTARFQAMAENGLSLLSSLRRVDAGRLDIPVYLSLVGEEARHILPDRRQMGKGVDRDQAEASALMELVERYSFFAFWKRLPQLSGSVRGTWSEAQAELGSSLISLEEILQSVHDVASPGQVSIARQLFDLMPWTFVPTLHLGENRTVRVPAEWFWMINECNGCSAGNTVTESILQGVYELIERHVCAVIARSLATRPSIRTETIRNSILRSLLDKFAKENIQVVLKDFSLDMPAPTVAVLAIDPATFPMQSEIVFTASTATSPTRAAIRALTEAAQLGGDFCTRSCYSPSGLPKYGNRHEVKWLENSDSVQLTSLSDSSAPDMLDELLGIAAALRRQDIQMYSLDVTHPDLRIPAHYTMAPGLDYLQRDIQDGVGLFIV